MGFMIQGLASGLLMFAILELHDSNNLALARTTETKIVATENQRHVQLVQNQTMAQFIDMLGHEARNTLAVVNISISGPKNHRSAASACFSCDQRSDGWD